MRIIFSIIQILILSGLVFGQKKNIYQKSVDSKQIDNLTLNVSDAYLSVKQSKDNQIDHNKFPKYHFWVHIFHLEKLFEDHPH